jgi:hypothetical protein
LSEFGGREWPALRQRYEALLERWERKPEQTINEYGSRLWVMYAIGLSEAPEARPYIQRQLDDAKSRERTRTPPLRVRDLEYILSMGT